MISARSKALPTGREGTIGNERNTADVGDVALVMTVWSSIPDTLHTASDGPNFGSKSELAVVQPDSIHSNVPIGGYQGHQSESRLSDSFDVGPCGAMFKAAARALHSNRSIVLI
jgi:hypothetical protein